MALVIVHRDRGQHQDIWYFGEHEGGALEYRGRRLHCYLLYSTEDLSAHRLDIARDPLAWRKEERGIAPRDAKGARAKLSALFTASDPSYVAAASAMLAEAEVVDYNSFVGEVRYVES